MSLKNITARLNETADLQATSSSIRAALKGIESLQNSLDEVFTEVTMKIDSAGPLTSKKGRSYLNMLSEVDRKLDVARSNLLGVDRFLTKGTD